MAATQNHQKVLGKGGFGPVYYGKLASGKEVAVKVAAKGSAQGSQEFINEVPSISQPFLKCWLWMPNWIKLGDQIPDEPLILGLLALDAGPIVQNPIFFNNCYNLIRECHILKTWL